MLGLLDFWFEFAPHVKILCLKIGDTDEDSAMRNTRTGSSVAGPVANEVCYVRHKMETTLNDVGLQVWNGALLMCDYILQNQQMFKGMFLIAK